MASKSASMAFFLLLAAAPALAQPSASPPAPAGPINITEILAKGNQYSSFIRLLHVTGVEENINRQLNSSYTGLTVFAPTDNAFDSLKPGTLNALGTQQKILLAFFHVLPHYYTLASFQTASNPLMTEAADTTGQWTINFTAVSGQVNVSTGVVVTPISYAVYEDFPLVVYSIEKVLLPYEIFGPKPPAAAPAPSKEKKPSPTGPDGSTSGEMAPPPNGSSASLKGREVGWSFVAGFWALAAAAAAW